VTEQSNEAARLTTDRADEEATSSAPKPRQVVVPDISGILDQIDAVLEKNSEEFVSGFVQKGGQ